MQLLMSQAVLPVFEEGEEAFINHIEINRNLSTHTVRAYGTDIREFVTWFSVKVASVVEKESADSGVSPDKPDIVKQLPSLYAQHIQKKAYAKATASRKLSSVKAFFRFLMKDGFFKDNALPLNFVQPKQSKRLPDFLDPQDVKKLQQAPSLQQGDALSRRNRTLLSILFSSGIRVSELVSLNSEDINLDEGELRVLGKGGRERLAFMSTDALACLKNYLKTYHHLDKPLKDSIDVSQIDDNNELVDLSVLPPNAPVFLNKNGGRLNVRSVRRWLNELAVEVSLDRELHPHLFRHTFATHLLNKGVDLRIVQELLGHISIRSTQIYTHVSMDRLKKAYLQAHPRANQD